MNGLWPWLGALVLWVGVAHAAPPRWGEQVGGSRTYTTESSDEMWAQGPDGSRHIYRLRSEQRGDKRWKVFEYTHGGRIRTIRSWRADSGRATTFEPLAVRVARDGQAYALVNRSVHTSKGMEASVVLFRGPRQHTTIVPDHHWSSAALLLDNQERPVSFGRHFLAIEAVIKGRLSAVFSNTLYDWSAARDLSGRYYVTAYDYSDRSLYIATRSGPADRWQRRMVDTEESGWQHTAAICDGQLIVLYYFYRNAFNKGLRIATFRDGALEVLRTHARGREQNLGWEPSLRVRDDGVVEVSFLGDVELGLTQYAAYDALKILLAVEAEPPEALWEDEYRSLFLLGGADITLSHWSVWVPYPSADEALERTDAIYAYDPAMVVTLPLELRYNSFNFGVSYTRNLVADQLKTGSTVGDRSIGLIAGYVGFDDLFLGHDVRLTTSAGHFTGRYSDDTGADRATSTDIRGVELAFLNQRRVSYGLTYRSYSLRQPIYGWYAPSGASEYSFSGHHVVDADIQRAEVFIGYSKLDYLAKYETRYSGLNVDGRLGLGVGISTWDKVEFIDEDSAGTGSLAFTASLRLLYLYYRRFAGLRGAGLYARVGYEARFEGHGLSNGRPSDRKIDDLEDTSFTVRDAHHQVFHGPFVGLGLVY